MQLLVGLLSGARVGSEHVGTRKILEGQVRYGFRMLSEIPGTFSGYPYLVWLVEIGKSCSHRNQSLVPSRKDCWMKTHVLDDPDGSLILDMETGVRVARFVDAGRYYRLIPFRSVSGN